MFRRNVGIGVLGHVVLVVLVGGGLFLAARFGGEGAATAAALSFLPALLALGAAYLVVLLVIVAVPAARARVGSGPGLLLGWLTGALLVAVGFAALVTSL
ncbi:hypothetical protein [Actinoplanes sp. NPDC051494]|uniref:hypothetical protein n=1 Tax=Actinoplanes sp. NPDC051494 TaxID=3363907 RepID=UPI003795BF58